jgi:hypothetical protein
MDFSAIIPVGPKDISFFLESFHTTRKNLPDSVYIITKNPILIEGCTVVTEDIFPFKLSDIPFGERSGWYFQQLLKLYAPILLNLDKVLILDADTILLKPVDFFKDGKINFNVGTEYHRPYFVHMAKLLGLEKKSNYSGICHLMPIRKYIIQDLINRVEQKHQKPFWKAAIDCVDPAHSLTSGMSEYELLFNFCLKFYPSEVQITQLNWRNVSNKSHITSDLDYVSIHWYMR